MDCEDDEDEEGDDKGDEGVVEVSDKCSILIFQSCTFKKDARCIGVSDEL